MPRHNPVNAFTMGGIVRDAGLTADEFRKLLRAAGSRTVKLTGDLRTARFARFMNSPAA
jgi:hypothetical protein